MVEKQKVGSVNKLYRILGQFKDDGERIDWVPYAPRLTNLDIFWPPTDDTRAGFIVPPKGETWYIVAVKVHVRGCRPYRVENFTGWRINHKGIERIRPKWDEVQVPDAVKRAAEAYLVDWLGWFWGKKEAKKIIASQEIEWMEISRNDPVNEETKDYQYHR